MTTQRPIGVILVAIWFFIAGLLAAGNGAVNAFMYQNLFELMGWGLALLGIPAGTMQIIQILFIVIGLVLIASGLGYWVTAVGLLQGREWGRIGGIIVAIAAALGWIGLAVLLVAFFGQWVLSMVIVYVIVGLFNALPILYLFSGEARQYCGGGAPAFAPPAYPLPPTVRAAPPAVSLPPTQRAAPPPPPPPSRAAAPPLEPTKLVSEPSPVMGWLAVQKGSRAGQNFKLGTGKTTIGRDGARCEIVLDDDAVSKEHARVQWEHGQFVLHDLASTNGTFWNERRIQRQGLLDGDEIRVGNTVMVFKKA